MTQKSLQDIFSGYMDKKSIFKDKNAITTSFHPEEIAHRDKQLQELAGILSPILKNTKPSNLFLYGSVGTGKTVTTNYVIRTLNSMAQKNGIPFKTIYLNCKMKKVADTEYRVMCQMARDLGEEIPSTGLPTDEVYDRFFKKLDEEERIVLIVLDEIDALFKKIGDNFLYTLARINEDLKNAKVCVVGISNDLHFTDYLDSRIKSSLSEEEIIFPPYNAFELVDILKKRAELAFEEQILGEGVIQKCAALAAQEHGDARRALDLLRVSGELADRENTHKVGIIHVTQAQEKIEKDKTLETVKSQPRHTQLLLYSMLNLYHNKGNVLSTGDVFGEYSNLCKKTGLEILTTRRISDLISSLDVLGIISAKVISKGRYGRTRSISLNVPEEIMEKIEQLLKDKFYL